MKLLLCWFAATVVSLCAQNRDPVPGDRLDHWVSLNTGLPMQVAGISVIASGGASETETAYAITGLSELFRSGDRGASWQRLNGLSNVVSVVPSADSTILYAATSAGFFRSVDEGEHWTAGGPQPGVQPNVIAPDPLNPDGVYVLNGFALFKSGDRGVTWSPIYTFPAGTSPGWLGIDPANPSNLYVSMINGGAIYKSTDGGQSFASILPQKSYVQFTPQVETIAIDPQNSSTLYAGLFTTFPVSLGNPPMLPAITGAISKSTDGGQTWRVIQNGIPAADIVCNIVIDPSNSRRLFASFAATDTQAGGVLASTDAGETWTEVFSVPASSSESITLLVTAGVGVVYAAYYGENLVQGGIAASIDGGVTWADASRGLAYYDLRTFAGASNVLYTGGSQGLFKSADSGADWTPLSLPQTSLANPPNPPPAYVKYGQTLSVFRQEFKVNPEFCLYLTLWIPLCSTSQKRQPHWFAEHCQPQVIGNPVDTPFRALLLTARSFAEALQVIGNE
jgi:photosystem II stability/assembly factor-like uncharacterized protein